MTRAAPATTKAKDMFDDYLIYGGFGRVERECVFHPTRKWRFDWALPERKIAFEYDGFLAPTSRHATGEERNTSHGSINGILRDTDKINAAQLLGWRVFRVNAKTIHDGSAFTLADAVLRGDGDGG